MFGRMTIAKSSFPKTPQWRVLRQIIDQIEPLYVANFTNGLNEFKRSRIDLRELERLIQNREWSKIDRIIPFDGILDAAKLDEIYSGALLQTTSAQQEFFKRTVQRLLGVNASGFAVNLDNMSVQRWLTNQVGTLVRGITAESQQSIQQAITSSIGQGLPPRAAARTIQNSIGLTPKQVDAVANFESKLRNGDFGKLTPFQRRSVIGSRRGAEFDRETLLNLSEDRIEGLTSDYAQRQLRHRATVIAQNELQDTLNFGQSETWDQAFQQNLADVETTRRQWIVTEDDRLCSICRPLAGIEVAAKEPWTLPDGSLSYEPKAHIGCRCAQTLVFEGERR